MHNTNTPLAFALYTRKSTDEKNRQVLSIASQREEMLKIAKAKEIPIREIFEEKHSAFKLGRPEFARLVAGIEEGKFDAVICWKLDRLARNLEDGWKLATLLTTGKLKQIQTFDRVYYPSDNLVFISLEFAMATQYSRDLSTGIKRGIRKKLRDGVWPNRAPFGYTNERGGKGVVLDPLKAPYAKWMFELYATGSHSLTSLAKQLQDRAKPARHAVRITRRTCESVLNNPFFYGSMPYGGELFPGTHAALVSKSVFDQVQRFLRGKSKRCGYRYKPFDYRGLFKCASCGCVITMEIQKGIRYWRCTKKRGPCAAKRYLREDAALRQVETLVRQFQVPQQVPALLGAILRDEENTEMLRLEHSLGTLRQELAGLEGRKKQLLDLLLAGAITEEEFRNSKNELVLQTHELEQKIRVLNNNPLERLEPDLKWVSELNQAVVLETEGNPGKTANFLKTIGSNWQIEQGAVKVSLKRRWQTLLDWKNQFGAALVQNPIGYQTDSVRCLLDKARMGDSMGGPDRD